MTYKENEMNTKRKNKVLDLNRIDGKMLIFTELSNPNVNSIMKKINAQKVLPGIVAIAAGYTTNTKPGPSVATSSIL